VWLLGERLWREVSRGGAGRAGRDPWWSATDVAVALAAQLAAYSQVVYAHAKEQLVRDALARIDAVSFDTELATARLWEAEESRAARRLQRARLEGRSE